MIYLHAEKTTLQRGLFGLSMLKAELEDRGFKGNCAVFCDFETGSKRFWSLDEAIKYTRELHDRWTLVHEVLYDMTAGFKIEIRTDGNPVLKAWLAENIDELEGHFRDPLTDVSDTTLSAVYPSISEAIRGLDKLYYGTLLKYGPGCASVAVDITFPSYLYPGMDEDDDDQED